MEEQFVGNPYLSSSRSDVGSKDGALLPIRPPPLSRWQRFRRSRRLVIVVVTVVVMLDVMLITCLEPILPNMLEEIEQYQLNKTDTHNTTWKTLYEKHAPRSGLILGMKPGLEVITNLLVGYLVDREGHHWPMIFGSLVYVASTIGFALSTSVSGLIVTRAVQALGSSLSVVSGLSLLASTFTDDTEREKASSIVFGGLAAGLILGFPFGALVYQFSGKFAPFAILGALGLLDGLLRLVIYTDSDKHSGDVVHPGEVISLLQDPFFLTPILVSFQSHFALGCVFTTVPIYMQDVLKAEMWQMALVILCSTSVQFTTMYMVSGRVPPLRRWVLILCSSWVYALGMYCYPYITSSVWMALIPECILRLGLGLFTSVCFAHLCFISDKLHHSQYGCVNGLYTSSMNLGMFFGSVYAGQFLRKVGFNHTYWGACVLLLCTSITAFIGFFLKSVLKRREKSAQSRQRQQSRVSSVYDAQDKVSGLSVLLSSKR